MLSLVPRMSEKAYRQSTLDSTYVFVVPTRVNKLQVKDAVEKQFNVTVEAVNIVVQKGKKARSIRLGNRKARPIMGERKNIKKAYVRLKDGDSIKIFDEGEEKK